MKIHFPSVTLHLFLSCLLLICLPIQADTRDISIQSTDLFNQQNKVHIAIGISNYNTKNTGFGRLKYAAKDASLLSNTFRTKGYHPIRILDHNANKQTILNKIKRAGKLFPKGEGTLIFSFSGHGYKQGGRSYLATYDAYASNLRGTGLTVQEVVHTIRQTGVRRAILLLDACRNNPLPGQKSIGKSKALGGVNPGRGIQILYSTNQGNVSWEHKSIQQGVFSYFVNRALNGNVAKKNGAVTFNDLAQYVTREVPLWTDSRLSETQQPYRGTAGEFYGDFVMVSRKINTARVTQRPRPAVINQTNNKPRPLRSQTTSHYHGQKNHQHAFPKAGILHRHGQGMKGSRLVVKTPNISYQSFQETNTSQSENIRQQQTKVQQHDMIITKTNSRQIGQYIDHGDGTVTDTNTGFMWTKCSIGNLGNNCLGKSSWHGWRVAERKYKKVSYAGYNDWRLPTINELKTLVYCSNGIPQQEAWDNTCSGKNNRGGNYQMPTINSTAFPNVKNWARYWSSTQGSSLSGKKFIINFDNGKSKLFYEYANSHVRLVRKSL